MVGRRRSLWRMVLRSSAMKRMLTMRERARWIVWRALGAVVEVIGAAEAQMMRGRGDCRGGRKGLIKLS